MKFILIISIIFELFFLIIFLDYISKKDYKYDYSYSNISPYYMKLNLTDDDRSQLKNDFKNILLLKYPNTFFIFRNKFQDPSLVHEMTKVNQNFKLKIIELFQEEKGSLICSIDSQLLNNLKEIVINYEFKNSRNSK